MISCQPTALKAVRLQSLVPPSPEKLYIRDLLVKNEVNTPKISRTIQAMILNSKKAVAVKVIAFKHIVCLILWSCCCSPFLGIFKLDTGVRYFRAALKFYLRRFIRV